MMNPNQAQFGGSFQQPQQQPKGCLGRNWKWAVPLGCVTLILVLVAAGGALFLFAMSAVKSSDVYKGALERAQKSPEAVALLGQPIKDGWLVKGSVSLNGGSGNANMEIPVSGPKNSGTLYVSAINEGGAWMYEKLDLLPEGGQKVSLLDRSAEPEAGAPAGAEGETDDAEDAGDGEGDEVAPPPPPAAPNSPSDGVRTISGGVLNAKALSKPEPSYPPVAKAAHATGVVTVQVTVDEEGNVISATAVSGHPLLQAAAVAAARQAKLSPTLLSGKPVRVTGFLTYSFLPVPE
jgi:TonB family protein